MGKTSYFEPDQLKIELLMLLGSGIIEFFCYSNAISHQLFAHEAEPDEWEIELLMLLDSFIIELCCYICFSCISPHHFQILSSF